MSVMRQAVAPVLHEAVAPVPHPAADKGVDLYRSVIHKYSEEKGKE